MKRKTSITSSDLGFAIEVASKALVSAAPYLGGPISSVWSDVQTRRKGERYLEFLEELKQDLEQTQLRMNEDFVSKEDFLDIFEETIRKVIVTRHKEKREAFRHILTNAILSSNVSYDEIEEFIRLVDRLRAEHIFLLSILKDPVAYDEATGNRVGKGGGITTSLNQIMQKLLPDWTEATTVEVLSQLEAERLIQNILPHFKTALTDQGIYHLRNVLTPKGARLCQFVLEVTPNG